MILIKGMILSKLQYFKPKNLEKLHTFSNKYISKLLEFFLVDKKSRVTKMQSIKKQSIFLKKNSRMKLFKYFYCASLVILVLGGGSKNAANVVAKSQVKSAKIIFKNSAPKYCVIMPVGGWSSCSNGGTSYPVNAAGALTFAGTDKLFNNPIIVPIFYGSGMYWDYSTAKYLEDGLGYLSSSSYFFSVFSLMLKSGQFNNIEPSFTMAKPIYYYGPALLNNQRAVNSLVQRVAKDVKVYCDAFDTKCNFFTSTKSLDMGNSMFILTLDPGYSAPSHFKLSSMAYDAQDTGFCGFHGAAKLSTTLNFAYGIVGTGGKNCQWKLGQNYQLPNPGWNDMAMSVFVHELSEMLTDPFGGGFRDNMNLENADKCSGFAGGASTIDSSNRLYNLRLGNYYYFVQAQYNATDNTCKGLIYE
jgi:hypothetical protein